MSLESGEFVCPRCHKDPFETYKKWQKKNEKWIFFYVIQNSRSFWRSHKSHLSQKYVSSHPSYIINEKGQKLISPLPLTPLCESDNLNDNPETLWITSGGSTEQEWMSIWQNERLSYCFRCNYKSSSFIEFTKFRSLENAKLHSEIEVKEKENKVLSDRIIDLENQLKGLQPEISSTSSEESMTIKFSSSDEKIKDYEIKCKESDTFVDIEKKIYKDYPQYKDEEPTFKLNGKKIKRFKTIKENEIKDNDIINIILE